MGENMETMQVAKAIAPLCIYTQLRELEELIAEAVGTIEQQLKPHLEDASQYLTYVVLYK